MRRQSVAGLALMGFLSFGFARPGCASGSCDSPDGALAVPLYEACQLLTMHCDAGPQPAQFYSVDLVAGHRYAFSLCSDSCAGASVGGFPAGLEIYDPSCTLVDHQETNEYNCSIMVDEIHVWPWCDGRYVVRIESRTNRLVLRDVIMGYRETCLPPRDVFVEERLMVPAEGCEADFTVTVTTDGPGPYTWDWDFVVPFYLTEPTPPSGSATTTEPRLTITARMPELNYYPMNVFVTNACGMTGGYVNGDSSDVKRPTIAMSNIECSSDTIVMAEEREPLTADRAPAPSVLPPAGCDLPCAAPCTSGVLALSSNPWYEAIVDCATGALTLRTGPAHPLTVAMGHPVGMLAGADIGAPVGADLHWMEQGLSLPYGPTDGNACLTDPPDTPEEPASQALEVTWRWRRDPAGDDFWLREQVVIFGDDVSNAGVRLSAMHVPTREEKSFVGWIKIAWFLDPDLAGDKGPLASWQDCWRPERTPPIATSEFFNRDEIEPHDVLRLDPNDGPGGAALQISREGVGWIVEGRSSSYIGFGTPTMLHECRYDCLFRIDEGVPGADDDSALVIFMETNAEGLYGISSKGRFRQDGLILRAIAPDEGCGPFDDGGDATLVTCAPACITLDAATEDECGPLEVTPLDPSPLAPPCPTLPCTVDLALPGVYRYGWQVTDAPGNVRHAGATIRVLTEAECNHPPSCEPGAISPETCRRLILDNVIVSDAEGDLVTWHWECGDPRVTISPASGSILTSASGVTLPPMTATLDDVNVPCGVVVGAQLVVDDGFHPRRHACDASLTFRDEDLPIVEHSLDDAARLWPPNHRMHCFQLADFAPAIADACGSSTTWRFAGCASDQPDEREGVRTIGDGNAPGDCEVAADGESFCVRAERTGTDPAGRRYSVAIVATDECGNTSSPTVIARIHVPHDQR